MAFTPGFDIRAAAEGAKAATDIALQPTIQETAKAAAKEAVAKSEYETGRYQALSEYMKSTAPGTKGAEYYQALNANQEIQERQNSIRQEEERIKGLSIEDQNSAYVHLDRQQKLLDAAVAKQQAHASKYLNDTFALLARVESPESLEGSRATYRDEVAAVADQAVKDGKIAPENREAFINDQVNKIFPKVFDENGKAKLDSQMAKLTDAQTMLKFREDARKEKKLNSEIEKQTAALNRSSRATESATRSADLKTMQLALDTVHKEVTEGETAIRNTNDQIDTLNKELKEIYASGQQKIVLQEAESWFGSDIEGENPRIKIIEDEIKNKTGLLNQLREQVDQAKLGRDVLKEKLGIKKLPATPKAEEGNTQSRFKNDPSMGGYSLGKKTETGYEVLDSSGKLIGHYK